MKATIWHNPACGTSRKTLAILEETPGVDVTVVEYLKHPPSADKLAQLYRDAGLTPQQGLRLRGTDAEERGLPQADAAIVLAAMAADSRLLERPLVETGKGVRLCRPQEKVLEILLGRPPYGTHTACNGRTNLRTRSSSNRHLTPRRIFPPHDQHRVCP